MIGMTARVVHNELPTFIADLGLSSDAVVKLAAEKCRELWSNDVRVSPGAGNYAEGGASRHYRDNIHVDEVAPGIFWIWTPVPYSRFNEYGSITISAKPSARNAAEETSHFMAQLMAEVISGKRA